MFIDIVWFGLGLNSLVQWTLLFRNSAELGLNMFCHLTFCNFIFDWEYFISYLVFYRFNFEIFPYHNPSHNYSTIFLRCFQQNENIFCGYECIWYEILDKLFYAIVRRLLTTATFLLPNSILGRSFFIIDSLKKHCLLIILLWIVMALTVHDKIVK